MMVIEWSTLLHIRATPVRVNQRDFASHYVHLHQLVDGGFLNRQIRLPIRIMNTITATNTQLEDNGTEQERPGSSRFVHGWQWEERKIIDFGLIKW
jgi:hypothetical protein